MNIQEKEKRKATARKNRQRNKGSDNIIRGKDEDKKNFRDSVAREQVFIPEGKRSRPVTRAKVSRSSRTGSNFPLCDSSPFNQFLFSLAAHVIGGVTGNIGVRPSRSRPWFYHFYDYDFQFPLSRRRSQPGVYYNHQSDFVAYFRKMIQEYYDPGRQATKISTDCRDLLPLRSIVHLLSEFPVVRQVFFLRGRWQP